MHQSMALTSMAVVYKQNELGDWIQKTRKSFLHVRDMILAEIDVCIVGYPLLWKMDEGKMVYAHLIGRLQPINL